MARAAELKCPGGEIVHPVLSRNPADVQCRIDGTLRPATGKIKCCDAYWTCKIWQAAEGMSRASNLQRRIRESAISGPGRHVLDATR